MALSSNCMLIVLLVTFAVIAPSLPPSAAARDGGAAKEEAAAAPAPSASGEALQPMGLIDGIIGQIIHLIPDLPLPQILPCPPDFPIKIPLIPCYNVTPPPPAVTECRSSLVKLMPTCGGFLSNASSVVSPPSKMCCNAVNSFFGDSLTLLCLCHVMNGDADELLPAPVNQTRALNFLEECGHNVSPGVVTDVCEGNRDKVPPMDAPTSPPPRRQGTKA